MKIYTKKIHRLVDFFVVNLTHPMPIFGGNICQLMDLLVPYYLILNQPMFPSLNRLAQLKIQ